MSHPIFKHIPGTKEFTRDLKKKVVTDLTQARLNFFALSLFSDNEKQEIFNAVTPDLKDVMVIEERTEKVSSLLFSVLFCPLAFYCQLVLPFNLNNHYKTLDYSGWNCFYYFMFFLLFIAVFILGTILPAIFFNDKGYNKRRGVVLQGCYYFVMVTLSFYFPYKRLGVENTLWLNGLYSAMFSSAIYLTGIVVILIGVMEPLSYFMKSRLLDRIPQSKFIALLIKLFEDAEAKELFYDNELKRTFMYKLENGASIIERKIPKVLDGFDKINKKWIKSTYSEIAHTFRLLKREVAVVGYLSKEAITGSLKEFLIKASNNNWKAITRTKLPKEIRLEAARNRTIFYLRTFLVAFVPLGLIMINKHYLLFEIDSSIQHYLDIVSALWLVISILIIIDPSLRDKISAIKDVASYKGFKNTD